MKKLVRPISRAIRNIFRTFRDLLSKKTRLEHVFRHPELTGQKGKPTSEIATAFAEAETDEQKWTHFDSGVSSRGC